MLFKDAPVPLLLLVDLGAELSRQINDPGKDLEERDPQKEHCRTSHGRCDATEIVDVVFLVDLVEGGEVGQVEDAAASNGLS